MTALAVVALVPAGRAEETPPDPFSEELLRYRSFFDYGGFRPDLSGAFPGGYSSRLSPVVGLDATYSDNVDKTAEGEDAFWADGFLGISWLRRSPRLEGSADYRYSSPLYESGAAEERDLSQHTAAGAVRWQAAERLSLSAGGSLAQNFERGLETPLPGVRSSYDNRSDQYGAHAEGSWQASEGVAADASYVFSYRDYVSDRAEGQDTLSHRGTATLGSRLSPRDSLNLGYTYQFEEVISGSQQRETQRGTASWSHSVSNPLVGMRSAVSFSYEAERQTQAAGVDYWSHSGTVGLDEVLSARTSGRLSAGYSWIVPEDQDIESSWTADASLSHQFSEYTSGDAGVARSFQYVPDREKAVTSLDYRAGLRHRFTQYTTGTVLVSQSWEERPANSRTDFTVLTKARRASAALDSRVAQRVRARLDADYEDGTRDAGDAPEGSGGSDYWQLGFGASLDGDVGRRDFWGARVDVTRRRTEDSTDDYLLQVGRLFYRRQLLDQLNGAVTYSHEQRRRDGDTSEDDYRENRLVGSLTLTW